MADHPSEPIERSAKTVDEAIHRALRDLDLNRSQVAVTVLREGRPGVLGIGAAAARVRVTPLSEGAQPEVPPPPSPTPPPPSPPPDVRRPTPGARRTRPERDRRPRGAPPAEAMPFQLLAPPDAEPDPDPVEHALHILTDLLHLLGIDAEISARAPETPMDGLDHAAAVLDINPAHPDDDLGLLIGRRGEYLAALQYLVNLMLSRRHKGQRPITIDIHHYKRRREEALNALALRLADQIRESRVPVTMEPMPAAERRIVHLALSEDPDVETESVGEGDARKVTIVYREDG